MENYLMHEQFKTAQSKLVFDRPVFMRMARGAQRDHL